MTLKNAKCSPELGANSVSSISNQRFRRVEQIPRYPRDRESFYIESSNGHPTYTHYLFRFPAKFHPPVVSWALDTFGGEGIAVLDPFTGSGTVQVEALVRGMPSVGIDIDPLACFVTQVKTTPLPPEELETALGRIEAILSPFRRSGTELESLVGADISDEQFGIESQDLAFPAIPNMFHWFRRYVVVDLARLLWAVQRAELGERQARFFRACVAAIIRRVSNADPDPVSGLEVTRIQAERNARREFRVFDEFANKARKEIQGMCFLWQACGDRSSASAAKVIQGDVLRARELLAGEGIGRRFPLVVTSPPYCQAVNYSRRHKLEMYWLGFVHDREEHLKLAHSYVGRRRVRISDWDESVQFGIEGLDQTLDRIGERSHVKARALRHYFWSMSSALAELGEVIERGGLLICAIGDSVCCGTPVTTTQFVIELAAPHFSLRNRFSYAVRNHYMQYPLRNGRGIREEHVLVLKRR